MACKLDQMGTHVIAASSKQDEAKIIEIETNEVKHHIKDIGSATYSLDIVEDSTKFAFGTQKGEVNVLSWS